MRKGFSIVELLIALVIVAVILGAGVVWFTNYVEARKIENDVRTIHGTLKEAQLLAKTQKREVTVSLRGPSLLEVQVEGETDPRLIELQTPFESNQPSFTVDRLGVFSNSGNIHSLLYKKATVNCVNVYYLRVCEGSYDGKKCNCNF